MTLFSQHFRALVRIGVLAWTALTCAGQAEAQTPRTGSIRGNVADVQGALVVGAEVVLSDPNGNRRTGQSGSNGGFQFSDLLPGTYAIRVTKIGFATYENSAVNVAAGRAVTLDVT